MIRISQKTMLAFTAVALFTLLLSVSIKGQEYHGGSMMPEYKGGNIKIKEIVTGNLNFPDSVKTKGICGTVVIKIALNQEGKVDGLKLMRGIDPSCDAEALRLAGMLVDWKPAVNWGNPVNCNVLLPVEFNGESASPESPVTISGIICDMNTGKSLAGALVLIKGTNVGTITDQEGRYTLEVNSKNCDMDISFVGYKTTTEHIGNNRTINVDLEKGYYYLDYNL